MTEKRFEAKTIPADKRADWVVGIWDSGVLLNNFAVVRILNELNDENEQLKQTIREAYKTERTHIGRNVLKQLLEAIQ